MKQHIYEGELYYGLRTVILEKKFALVEAGWDKNNIPFSVVRTYHLLEDAKAAFKDWLMFHLGYDDLEDEDSVITDFELKYRNELESGKYEDYDHRYMLRVVDIQE